MKIRKWIEPDFQVREERTIWMFCLEEHIMCTYKCAEDGEIRDFNNFLEEAIKANKGFLEFFDTTKCCWTPLKEAIQETFSNYMAEKILLEGKDDAKKTKSKRTNKKQK